MSQFSHDKNGLGSNIVTGDIVRVYMPNPIITEVLDVAPGEITLNLQDDVGFFVTLPPSEVEKVVSKPRRGGGSEGAPLLAHH